VDVMQHRNFAFLAPLAQAERVMDAFDSNHCLSLRYWRFLLLLTIGEEKKIRHTRGCRRYNLHGRGYRLIGLHGIVHGRRGLGVSERAVGGDRRIGSGIHGRPFKRGATAEEQSGLARIRNVGVSALAAAAVASMLIYAAYRNGMFYD